MRIGFIGLGNMGLPMARNLLGLGHTLTVFNRTLGKAKSLISIGAREAASVADVAAEAEIVITMLSNDEALAEIVYGAGGLLQSLPTKAIHLCMSTIEVETSAALAAAHAKANQGYVAAPIFGRADTIESRRVWIIAGGPEPQVNRCLPIFVALGRDHTRVGSKASLAHALKLGGNLLYGAMEEAVLQTLAYAEKAGMAHANYLRLLNTAIFKSHLVDANGAVTVRPSFDPADQALDLAANEMLFHAAKRVGVPVPTEDLLNARLQAAVARGWGEQELAALSEDPDMLAALEGTYALAQEAAAQQVLTRSSPVPDVPVHEGPVHIIPTLPEPIAPEPQPPEPDPSSQHPPVQPSPVLSANQAMARQLPARQLPARPASTRQIPTPRIPEPAIPTPRVPAPAIPTPRVPAPAIPTPRIPAPAIPTPRIPTPPIPAPRIPVPPIPAPRVPAPRTTPPRVPTPRNPVFQIPTPQPPVPQVTILEVSIAKAPAPQNESHKDATVMMTIPKAPRRTPPERRKGSDPKKTQSRRVSDAKAPLPLDKESLVHSQPVEGVQSSGPLASSARLSHDSFTGSDGEKEVLLDLDQTTHFEVVGGKVWAWSHGKRYGTTWRGLHEVELTFKHVLFLPIKRHLLLRPEAVQDLRPTFGGGAKAHVGNNMELDVGRAAAARLKELLGL